MYNVSTIQAELFGLVGFEQPIDPDYAIVDASNQASSSGRFFTDSEFVKIPWIIGTQDYVDASDADINTVLAAIQKKSIVNVIDRIYSKSDFIDRQLLYRFSNNKTAVDTLPNGFVGYEIEVSKKKNYCFEIKRDILEFSGTGDITLALYSSHKSQPLETKVVSITSNYQEVEMNWKVDNTDVYKGKYYYGYLTDGVSVEPYRREYQNSNVKSVVSGLRIENMQVSYSPSSGELWDLSLKDGASECWGLNPDFIIYEDYTDFIVQSKRLFARAIQLSGQIYCIGQYVTSGRSNIDERSAKDIMNRATIEVEGIDNDGFKKVGLKVELAREISRLSKEIDRMRKGLFAHGLQLQTRS